jgi:hypothetical protein
MKNFYLLVLAFGLLVAQSAKSQTHYSEDFESGAAGWTTGGTNSAWELGVPINNFIPGTPECGGGNNAWVTNLDGDYNINEQSYL